MSVLKHCCSALALLLLLTAPSLASRRDAAQGEERLTRSQLEAAGSRPMTREEVLAFIAERNGRLQGDFGVLRDSLRLYDDGTVRGECSTGSHSPTPGSGTWSVDEDGVLRLSVTWKYADKQDSTGRLYLHGAYLYQMDGGDPARSWLYRIRR